jgi:hypothetical protein
MKLRYLVLPLVIAGSLYVGIRYEATRIPETTCENDNALTILNGTTYVCLTVPEMQTIQHLLKERGI